MLRKLVFSGSLEYSNKNLNLNHTISYIKSNPLDFVKYRVFLNEYRGFNALKYLIHKT